MCNQSMCNVFLPAHTTSNERGYTQFVPGLTGSEASRVGSRGAAHMKELGIRLNTRKVSPVQRITYLSVVWDSNHDAGMYVPCSDRVRSAQIESILTSVKRVREGRSLTVKQFQKLLGLMPTASNVIPFGLL